MVHSLTLKSQTLSRYYFSVRSGSLPRMAQSTDIPLPEITIEDFRRAWTRFELVATVKKWGEDKQLAIIPTLLRGRLVDYYIDLEEEEKFSVQELGKSLKKRAGLMTDPLAAARKGLLRRKSTSCCSALAGMA